MKSPFNITKAMLPFAAIILSIFLFTAAVEAATFTVTNTNDSGPGSLRSAIVSANANAGPDQIEFSPATFSMPQTILLTTGELVIAGDLTINGTGEANLRISGNNASRVFYVNKFVTATIDGLTITGGNGTGTIAASNGLGGGIENGGTLTITNSTISGNFAGSGGGGIDNLGFQSSLTLIDSTVTGNTAAGVGGGFFNTGTLIVINSTFSNNHAGTRGGGIYNNSDKLSVTGSTISGNSAVHNGGGIVIDAISSGITVANSLISGNSAGNSGGGIATDAGGSITVTNSTVSGNSAQASGGGVFNAGILTVTNSTLTGNRADSNEDSIGEAGGIGANATETLNNSIVAGNFRGSGSNPDDVGFGSFDNANSNLIGDAATSGGIIDGMDGNKVGFAIGNVLDTTLADNGGPTRTHALVPGSPAIDAGAANTLTTDQRGFARVMNGATDIGAYEFGAESVDTDIDGVPDGRDNCPAIHNSEKIAFRSDRDGNAEIYVMKNDGTALINLTNDPGIDIEPSFSSNGSKILFVSDRQDGLEIWVMDANGSSQTRLTFNSSSDSEPSFSPDGSKIVFQSFRDDNREIYLMNADGTGQTNLTNDPGLDVNPTFSPDGTKIAFSSTRDGDSEIYVMNADGSGIPTKLTANTQDIDIEPAFSPDGSKIAFVSDRDGGATEIFVMNADGTGQVNLTNSLPNTPDYDYSPSFSPDGSKIAFASDRTTTSHFEIFVMNADGTGQSNMTNHFEVDYEPSWGRQADSDGDGIGDACEENAAQQTATVMDPPAAADYSDVVALSSTTTSNGSPVATGSVEFFINGVSVGTDAVNANGVATLNTQILLAAGSYTVEAKYTASEADLLDSSDTDSLTVTKEDATVTASANNVVAVKVNAPGGTAGPVILCADITEAADGSLGDIALAVPVTFVMTPVAPGSPLQQMDAALSGGTACVTFTNVPVNVYDVTISVDGNYYTGMGSTVLAIFDPSLGFTTGGGRVVNPATGNTLHFGFSFKYDRRAFKGQMLVMEHTASGPVRLKSNSLTSLSIVGNQAIVLGKANIANGSGNLNFRLSVIDNGEPGTSDLFSLKTTTGSGSTITAFTIDPARTLVGGNIQVPQGGKK